MHAHPDDESIGQGATMAKYVAEGRGVTLVTCTAGEMGEILVPELEHLAADRDDALGEHRRGELDDAMKELGVTDHRFLGGFGTYRDSGMKWHEDGHAIAADDVHANAFWHADLTEAADHLVAGHPRGAPAGAGHLRPVRRLRPPRPHPGAPGRDVRRRSWPRCRRTGCDLGEPWDIAKIYWGAMSERRMRASLRALRDSGDTTTFEGMDPDGPLPHFVTPDELLSAVVDAPDRVDAEDGGAARPTPPRSPSTARSSRCRTTSASRCGARSSTGSRRAPAASSTTTGLETDLFAGL